MATARMTATPKTLLLEHSVRDVGEHGVRDRMVGLLEFLLHAKLGFVLPRNMPSDGVVPGERPRAVRARHSNALVTLPHVSA